MEPALLMHIIKSASIPVKISKARNLPTYRCADFAACPVMGHGQTRIRAKERRAGEQRAQRDRVEHERKRTAEQQRAEQQKQPGGDVARAQARPRVVL
jgi:hypothetical protein